jgi:cytosine/adenosine deaminase-related metal-dependent hydrolase
MREIDSLLHARWIVPVEPDGLVLEHHSLAIHEGRILDLLPTPQAEQRYQADSVTRLPEHLLIPGLVNAHRHVTAARPGRRPAPDGLAAAPHLAGGGALGQRGVRA